MEKLKNKTSKRWFKRTTKNSTPKEHDPIAAVVRLLSLFF